ncbi:MAG TPA: nucleoside transporter C-terminal domain-containing protein [Candidatus Acidoferrales bacterium]|nr:nucleoside transporter C-terminal domain-containing protein [Candidatus Acidoferrales bacterium]
MHRFVGLIGIALVIAGCWYFSSARRAIRLRTILWGMGLQLGFALFVLKTRAGLRLFEVLGAGADWLLSFSFAGSEFVFGPLGRKGAGGVVIAFQVLPIIIFIASFFAILYHYGVMQALIRVAARVMTRLMGASGAESLNVAASIFMGQTEAPLTIRPFLPRLTRSELMTVMTSGMAHVSGAVMGAYILFGAEARHMLAAVIMTAPGTLVIAKMLNPETEQPETAGRVHLERTDEEKHENMLGALTRGATDGLHLALNVAAMLIAFLALVALVNGIFSAAHGGLARLGVAWFPSSLQELLGWIFAPVAWCIGVSSRDCITVGNLLGTRMVLNEFVAYSQLGGLKAQMDPRSFTIATFALCGFANFGSIGIQIGGLSALAPNKRRELAELGFRAMIAGTLANLLSASIVGILL